MTQGNKGTLLEFGFSHHEAMWVHIFTHSFTISDRGVLGFSPFCLFEFYLLVLRREWFSSLSFIMAMPRGITALWPVRLLQTTEGPGGDAIWDLSTSLSKHHGP